MLTCRKNNHPENQWMDVRSKHAKSHIWRHKRVHTFPVGICAKVNAIARLEFEITNFNVAVQYVSHYTTETPGTNNKSSSLNIIPRKVSLQLMMVILTTVMISLVNGISTIVVYLMPKPENISDTIWLKAGWIWGSIPFLKVLVQKWT